MRYPSFMNTLEGNSPWWCLPPGIASRPLQWNYTSSPLHFMVSFTSNPSLLLAELCKRAKAHNYVIFSTDVFIFVS